MFFFFSKVIYYITLSYNLLYFITQYHFVLYCNILYCITSNWMHTMSPSIILHNIRLHDTVYFCTSLLYCIYIYILYCITLCYLILHCILLH